MDELLRRVELLRELTPREREVLQLTCDGLVNREIADRLVISGSTVLFHKGNIYQKLGIAELQQAPRQREIGRFCQAVSAAGGDDRQEHREPTPQELSPPQPSDRAMAAVREDDIALARQRAEEARQRTLPVVVGQTAPQTWTAPVPVPPVIAPSQRGVRATWVVLVAVIVVLAGALAVAVLWGRGQETVIQERPVTPEPAAQVPPLVTAASAPRTPEPTPTATPTPRPTPTPTPTPTARPVSGPTFVVLRQPAGCHELPSADAAIVVQNPAGAVLAMDQVIQVPDGTWYRQVDRQCWTRAQAGVNQVFNNLADAQTLAARFQPPLYQADWSSGTAGWAGVGGWRALNGMLLNDGSGDDASVWVAAPYQPPVADYAVEAEIQVVSWRYRNGGFGIVARGGSARFEGYWGGIRWPGSDASPMIWAGGQEATRPQRFGSVMEWHTYRLEVRGNTVRQLSP